MKGSNIKYEFIVNGEVINTCYREDHRLNYAVHLAAEGVQYTLIETCMDPIIERPIEPLTKDFIQNLGLSIPSYSLQEKLMKTLIESLEIQLEKTFIKGLGRKGFSFKDTQKRNKFIEENCKAEKPNNNQTIYYVKGEPFLMHNHRITMKTVTDLSVKVSASLGTFQYL